LRRSEKKKDENKKRKRKEKKKKGKKRKKKGKSLPTPSFPLPTLTPAFHCHHFVSSLILLILSTYFRTEGVSSPLSPSPTLLFVWRKTLPRTHPKIRLQPQNPLGCTPMPHNSRNQKEKVG